MAGLLCRCGAGMETTTCPSPHKLMIYYKCEIDAALQLDPNITLSDFLSDWSTLRNCHHSYMNRKEPVEYWFCTECSRVYEVQAKPLGHWLRIFKLINSDVADYDNWKQIFVLLDVETDDATERDVNASLNQYLKDHDSMKYYISPDESEIVAYSDNSAKKYILEDTWLDVS